MVPGRSRVRRYASVAVRFPGLHPRSVIRGLLMTAGILVAGWLLGSAGQAHADTIPGARLPSAAAYAGRPVTLIAGHVPSVRVVVPAVRTAGAVLRSSPAILAPPPARASVATGAPRPSTSAGMAGSSRARRLGRPGSRAGIARGPVIHTDSPAATGASEKATTEHATRSAHAPSTPAPRPLPDRAQALPPSAGYGIDQTAPMRAVPLDAAQRRPIVSAIVAGAVPPAVRTAADEPSFSPD